MTIWVFVFVAIVIAALMLWPAEATVYLETTRQWLLRTFRGCSCVGTI